MKNLVSSISKQQFSFVWEDPMHTTPITVMLPDLQGTQYNVSGDWGPMYTINLKPNTNLRIVYDNQTCHLESKTLNLLSPMLATQRAELPLFIRLNDESKGLVFQLYLDHDMNLRRVEVIRASDYVCLFADKVTSNEPKLAALA